MVHTTKSAMVSLFLTLLAATVANANTHNGITYTDYGQTLRVSEAQVYCESRSQYLFQPRDQTDIDFVLQTFSKAMWLGVTDSITEGTWLNFDGTPAMSNLPWSSSEPNNSGEAGEHYATLSSSGTMNDVTDYPTLTRGFICQSMPYVSHNGINYVGINTQMTQADARAHCEGRSLQLAMPKDQATTDFLKSTYAGFTRFWIGLSDQWSEGNFYWDDHTALGSSYDDWGSTQPDNAADSEHCVEIRIGESDWNDIVCSETKAFVCQQRNEFCNGDRCYFASVALQDHDAAKEWCYGRTAYLVNPKSADDTNFLMNTFTRAQNADTHTGVEYNPTSAGIFYSDGTNVDASVYDNWSTGEPNGHVSGSELCGEMNLANGLWNDIPCSGSTNTVICQLFRGSETCHGTNCFLGVVQEKTYQEAQTFCSSRSYALAVSNTAESNSFLSINYSNGLWPVAWLGMDDLASEGNFVWSNGNPVTENLWNTGEPNDSAGNEDCGSLDFNLNAWNDRTCTNEIRFLCAFTITSTPSESASTTPSESASTTPSESASTTSSESASTTPSESASTTSSESASTTPSESASTTPSETASASASASTPASTEAASACTNNDDSLSCAALNDSTMCDLRHVSGQFFDLMKTKCPTHCSCCTHEGQCACDENSFVAKVLSMIDIYSCAELVAAGYTCDHATYGTTIQSLCPCTCQ